MRVAFNGVGCGWGNNGGTQSIFRMADALIDLGLDVELWSDIKNQFTWFSPKATLVTTTLNDAPEVDVLINTGCHTTLPTYNFPKKKIGVQWLRAHETWQKTEDELDYLYGIDMPLWANSEWFSSFLDCEIQYCGIPHSRFYKVEPIKTDKFTIGCLWNTMPTKGGDLINRMIREMGNVEWLIFGKTPNGPTGNNVRFVSNPTMSVKRTLYSSCDVWFAPTELEGLHIPPMEAALCGVPVVANAKKSAGNMDYCVNNETALLYNNESEIPFLIDRLKDKDLSKRLNLGMISLIKTKIGDVDVNAKRMLAKLKRLI